MSEHTFQTFQERDQRAEVITRFLDVAKDIHAFHGKKMEDVFHDEQSKRAFLKRITKDEFRELIDGTNGILRGKEKGEWMADGEMVDLTGATGTVIPPQFSDKLLLLADVFEAMKQLNERERSLEDIALLVAASLNEIHLYNDGNGRLTRFLFVLLTENFNGKTKEKIEKVLGEYGRDEIDIDPSLLDIEIRGLINREIGYKDSERNPANITNLFSPGGKEIIFREEIPEEIQQEIRRVITDKHWLFLAIFSVLEGQSDYAQFLQGFEGRSVIRTDLLFSGIGVDQMQEILEKYWSLKKKHTEILIDCIVNPEKPEYQVEKNGIKKSFLEIFRKEALKQ